MPPGKVHEGSNLETYLITEMKMYYNMPLTKANANYNLKPTMKAIQKYEHFHL